MIDPKPKASQYLNQSVERMIEILRLYIGDVDELTATEISKHLSFSQSTVFRFLVTLEYYGFLQRNPENNKYRLGVFCLELGNAYLKDMDLRQRAFPILKKLRDASGETVHLGILEDFVGVYIEKLDGRHHIGFMTSQLGGKFPLYCTGLGKVLLAHLSDNQIQNYLQSLDFKQITQNTITDPKLLLDEIDQIHRLGYAIDNEENEQGVGCIAAPIFKHNGLAGAISITGPADRITDKNNVQGLVTLVKYAAESISAQFVGGLS